MGFFGEVFDMIGNSLNNAQARADEVYAQSMERGRIEYAGDMMAKTSSLYEKTGYQRAIKDLAADSLDYELERAYDYFNRKGNQLACKTLHDELENRGLI